MFRFIFTVPLIATACTAPVVPEDDTASETGELEETDSAIEEPPPLVTLYLSYTTEFSHQGVSYAYQDEDANLGGILFEADGSPGDVVTVERIAPPLGLAIVSWSELSDEFSTNPNISGRDDLVEYCGLVDPNTGAQLSGAKEIDNFQVVFDRAFTVAASTWIVANFLCTPPDGTNPEPLALGFDLPIDEEDLVVSAVNKDGVPVDVEIVYGDFNGFPYPSRYVLLPYDLGWPNDPRD